MGLLLISWTQVGSNLLSQMKPLPFEVCATYKILLTFAHHIII